MRTDETLQELCDALTLHCGDLHEAARYCGVSPAFVMKWIKDDSEAADRIQEAQQVGYLGLESEARRRAVDGVEEDVYFQGNVVGKKINYSDTLLRTMLEARVPAYKKGEDRGNSFHGPTQINIMPRADSYEQWLGMRDTTLAQREEVPALPAVPKLLQGTHLVDEAEYTEVQEDKPLKHLADLGL